MDTWLEILWFLLPAGAANLVPPVAAKLFPEWNTPVDFGGRVRGRRLFGSHKTIRGMIAGTILSTITLKTQCFVSSVVPAIASLQISSVFCELWWLGPWFGLTALGGDLVKSFLKRQFDIQPGRPWVPWDQIDWILGVLAGTFLVFEFHFSFLVGAIMTGLLLSFAVKVIGYWIGVNQDWI